MDLQQLLAFDQIILQGSFSKAARRLHVSQPTISLRIQALEQEVGGLLFIRGGSKIQLTESGRSFLPYARQALRAMTTGVEVAQQTVGGKRGRVKIGTLPTLATGFFSATIARFHHLYPQLDIAVHTGHNQQILEMLYDDFVNIGFMTGPFFHPDMIILLHIHEPLLVVAHPEHPLARSEEVTVAQLREQDFPFFFVDWSLEVRHWQAQMMSGLRQPVVEVPPQTAYDLLVQRMGVALLTHSSVNRDLKNGRLVEIAVQDMPVLYRESVLVRLKRDELFSSAATEFVRILREETRGYNGLE